MKRVKWSKDIGYEVSTKGDRRFSPFFATLSDGRTIEEAYQLDIKGYRRYSNDVMLGKGKPPLYEISKEQLYKEYRKLWLQFANENKGLIIELLEIVKENNYMLKDRFAQTEINQARALADILNALIRRNNK